MTRSRVLGTIFSMCLAATLIGATLTVAEAATTVVKAADGNVFKPKTALIAKGDKVTWRNTDSAAHTVTAYGGNWRKNDVLSMGDEVGFPFRKAGVFKYRCRFHSTMSNGVCEGMCGKVRVTS